MWRLSFLVMLWTSLIILGLSVPQRDFFWKFSYHTACARCFWQYFSLLPFFLCPFLFFLSFFSLMELAHSHVAAAAKSLQSCLTLCDPTDSSPRGSPVPGILQARALEWVAISFSNASKWKVKVKSLSPVRLLATPWTAAYQAPLSMGFSRQEYWSGVPLPSPIHMLVFIIYIILQYYSLYLVFQGFCISHSIH